MSVKVRRGLGLLAIAVLAWGVQWVAGYGDATASGGQSLVISVSRLVLLVAGAAGLVLVAWGLLRE